MHPQPYLYALARHADAIHAPGSVGKTTKATFEQLSKRGQEWGDWEEQEAIAHSIAEFRQKSQG